MTSVALATRTRKISLLSDHLRPRPPSEMAGTPPDRLSFHGGKTSTVNIISYCYRRRVLQAAQSSHIHYNLPIKHTGSDLIRERTTIEHVWNAHSDHIDRCSETCERFIARRAELNEVGLKVN